MRRIFMPATVILMMTLLHSAVPAEEGIKQQTGDGQRDLISNPALPRSASKAAMEKRGEATRIYLQSLCDMNDAMKSFDERANQAIERASKGFLRAKSAFEGVGDLVSPADIKLSRVDRVPAEVLDWLKLEKYETPTSYKEAFLVLANHSKRIGEALENYRYKGDQDDNGRVLGHLLDLSRRASAIFVLITRLNAGPDGV